MIVTNGITPDQIAQRARIDAENAARAALQAEFNAEQQRRAAADRDFSRRASLAENEAVARLSETHALYSARTAAADKVVKAIAELWAVETQIQRRLADVDRILSPVLATIDLMYQPAHVERVRMKAGLMPLHQTTGADYSGGDGAKVARSVIVGILGGNIGPGGIVVGQSQMTINGEG